MTRSIKSGNQLRNSAFGKSMKRMPVRTFSILLIVMSLLSLPALATEHGAKATTHKKSEKMLSKAEANALVARLHEIRDIATNKKLTPIEKINLKREVRDIKDQLKQAAEGYIYISATTLIIILLLIIIL